MNNISDPKNNNSNKFENQLDHKIDNSKNHNDSIKSNFNNLLAFLGGKRRFFSALILGGCFTISILYFPKIFYSIIVALIAISYIEWIKMTGSDKIRYFFSPLIIPGFLSIILMRAAYGEMRTLAYFVHIWLVDIFAFIFGKNIGGIKLAPKISPNKTLSGFVLGILSASFISYLNDKLFNISNIYNLFGYYVFLGIIAQISDLFISLFKRRFGIKDFSNIIPGHGGVLDRFDSIILTAPLHLLLLFLHII